MESTNIFDKFNNEIFVGDIVIYSDQTIQVLDGIGMVTKELDGSFNIANVNGASVSSLSESTNLERKGSSK